MMARRASRPEFIFDTALIDCELNKLQPLRFVMVYKTALEQVWDFAVSKYHYLGYDMMIGPRLKYLVFSGTIPLAAISFNQAAYKVGLRDCFIGWNEAQKNRQLSLILNNNRFLILPWVKVKNLASHILSYAIKLLKADWPELYGIEPVLLETFVDSDKYKGTCYLASNWKYLGVTRGFARKGGLYEYHGNQKGVYVYPLKRNFRKIIGCSERPYVPALKKYMERRSREMVLQNSDWDPELIKESGITSDEAGKLGQLLLQYHEDFSNCYTHINQVTYGETYLMGLMSSLERKSIEPIALHYLDENDVRGMQKFFRDSPWKDQKMLGIYHSRLSSKISAPESMLTIDSSEFPKKGSDSVGVARQHCGVLGKTENCQSGVFAGYSGDKGYGLINCRLYVPEKWFDDDHQKHRRECDVPEDLRFKTKIEIALELIRGIRESGCFPAKWLGCDSFFGINTEFIDKIADDFCYFADVRSKTHIFTADVRIGIPEYAGRGFRPHKKQALSAPLHVCDMAEDDKIPWQSVILGEGSKGPIVSQVKCIRVFEHRKGIPGREVWLYIRKNTDGKIKYSLSNAPADIPLEQLDRAALMRWPIEQCFEECKSCLGMDHYETRSWVAWHRHMLFVFMAQLFLLEVRTMFKKNSCPDIVSCQEAGRSSCDNQNL